jgi:hypothetical protein
MPKKFSELSFDPDALVDGITRYTTQYITQIYPAMAFKLRAGVWQGDVNGMTAQTVENARRIFKTS